MAAGPNVIGSPIDQEKIKDIERQIDEKLSDHEWKKINRRGFSGRYLYRFVFPGTLTESEKKFLTNAYIQAGWNEVTVMNSEDNNEAPGNTGIFLYERDR